MTQLDSRPHSRSAPAHWAWYERLFLFGIGAGAAGAIACVTLQAKLSPPKRPMFPDPAMGYVYLLTTKYGHGYGTQFEYLLTTYGIWAFVAFAIVCGVFSKMLDLQDRPATRWHIGGSTAVWLLLSYAAWRLFFSGA